MDFDLSIDELEKIIDIQNINVIVKKHTNIIEGNCMYQHNSNFKNFEGICYDNKLILRKNLYTLGKNSKSIVEIGLNGGHGPMMKNNQIYCQKTVNMMFNLTNELENEAIDISKPIQINFYKQDDEGTTGLHRPTFKMGNFP